MVSLKHILTYGTVAVATCAAGFSVYDFIVFNLPRLVENMNNGLPGLFRITPTIALPVAIALALWMRKSAALWLIIVHALAYRLHYFMGADPFEGQGVTVAGLLRHPVSILGQLGVLSYLTKTKVLQ